jgi:hypothetical protein
MAAELIMSGPGKPVIHTAAHDLESLFYVLLGICVLFHSPYTPKSDQELEPCFDKYFNTYSPNLLKTMIIQSKVGWLREFCNNISPYFKPLVPLLNSLRKIIILPIDDCDSESPDSESSDSESPSEPPHPVTHFQVLQALEKALASLPDECWERKCDPKEQVVDPIVEYSLRKFTQAAAATEGVETPDGPDAPNTGDHTNANPTDTDEPTTTDTEPGPTPVLEDGHLVYPRFPRPPDIRAPSGPGFEQRPFSRDDDDDEYQDSDMPPSKRPRSTSRKEFSKSRHLGRRPLPVKLRNKTTSCLKERRREDNVVKRAGPAAQAGESSRHPLPDILDIRAPRVYMRAQTEPRYDPHSDSDAELEALRSSSLTPNPSSESDG